MLKLTFPIVVVVVVVVVYCVTESLEIKLTFSTLLLIIR